MRKKKPKEQEAHCDDCGSDMGILEDHQAIAALALQDACGCAFWSEQCGDTATLDHINFMDDAQFQALSGLLWLRT